jgi:hypothetical protein
MTDDSSVAASEVAGLPATIRVDGTQVPVWPPGQGEAVIGAARIACTRFADVAAYHRQLTDATLAAREDPRFHHTLPTLARAGCGDKVRAILHWDAAAALLIHARALTFAHRVTGRGPVYVDDAWGNIYVSGDYCLPHSHVRAMISIVYMLDPGDPDHDDPLAGRFMFVDPRIDHCCPHEPGRVTRPLVPDMRAGTMMAFAGEYVHCVSSYRGKRPRITLSWNITRERLAREAGSPVSPASPSSIQPVR